MIIAKITSGLGNQLFQYALAKQLSILNKTELYLDLRFYKSDYSRETNRTFKLDNFNIILKPINKPIEYISKATKLFPNRSFKPFFQLVKEPHYHFDKEVLNVKSDWITTEGYWHSEKYFIDIENIIRDELKFKNDPTKCFEQFRNKIIDSNNPISIHIRRGDYVNHPIFSNTFGFLGLDYYNTAIEILKTKTIDFQFFIFTDDVDWVRDNLKLTHEHTFVINTSEIDDLHLMSLCKHHIIANSSFSWWGAWLNSNSEKIVIGPQKWFNNQPDWNTKDLLPNKWIRV